MISVSTYFEIPYPPSTGNTMVRHTKTGGHYSNLKFLDWRNVVRARLEGLGMLVEGPRFTPVHIDIVACPPDKKARDADNLLKVVFDALVYSGVLADDSNKVIRGHSMIWSAPGDEARVSVSIRGA